MNLKRQVDKMSKKLDEEKKIKCWREKLLRRKGSVFMDKVERLQCLIQKVEKILKDNYPQFKYVLSSENMTVYSIQNIDRLLFMISFYRERLCLSVRNEEKMDMDRYLIENNSDDEVIKFIVKIIKENVNNLCDEQIKADASIYKERVKYSYEYEKYEKFEEVLLEHKKQVRSLYGTISVDECQLANQTINCLIRNGILSFSDMLLTPLMVIAKSSHLGRKSLAEIAEIKKKESINLKTNSSAQATIKKTEFKIKLGGDVSALDCRISEEEKDRMILQAEYLFWYTNQVLSEKVTERNYSIFRKRMGIDETESCTLRSIGKEYGISGERVRQVIKKCCRYCKWLVTQKALKMFEQFGEEKALDFLIYGVSQVANENFMFFIIDVLEKHIISKGDHKKYVRAEYSRFVKRRFKEISMTEKLHECITYPSYVNYACRSIFEKLNKKRDVSIEGNSGKLCMEGFGEVQYESLLERTIIESLSLCNQVVGIKTQSLIIEYTYKGKKRKYYPDVVLLLSNGSLVIAEVKPLPRMYDEQVRVKYKAMKQFCEENGFGYLMFDITWQSYEMILEQKLNEEAKLKFVEYIREQKQLDYSMYFEYCNENMIKIREILQVIEENEDIVFQQDPFGFWVKEETS